jgi:4-aminobutyrate aminotransferase-like enzyme
MGNGVPVAALVGRTDILDRYGARFRYFNTFAGSPAAAAAASVVLSVIEEDGLVEAAAATGILVRDALQAAADLLPGDNRVRGAGMMNGLDLAASPVDAADLAEDLRDHGVLVGTTGADGQTVKVRPPLVFGEPEVAIFRDRLLDVAGAYR